MIDLTTTLAKPVADLITLLLKPLIEKLQKRASKAYETAYHNIFNSYRDYLNRTFKRHSYFTSIVFKNEQKKLDDYYLPLTLLQHPNDEETTIERFPRKLFESFEKILIVDSAGMGKTTLLKYLFLCCIKEAAGIPIYIELRKLSKDKSIVAFINEQLADLAGLEESIKSQLVYELLDSGQFVLFFDGYDEIPEDQRAIVTAGLQSFIEKAGKNKYLMTSREETSLVAFAQFQRFTIRPLRKEEAYKLLRAYAADSNLSKTLINKLEQPENAAIHEFLTNPLLTSLLYTSFEYKLTIPLKKHHFYRQVFDALYETHDLTKEGGEYLRVKKSRIDKDQFELVLRTLGFLSYRKGKVEFTKDEWLLFIDKAKELSSDTKATSSSILYDLTHAVPLMIEDGIYIRWTHKSIQEYFMAQYIFRNTGGKQKEILRHYFCSTGFQKHINLLTLCADIDNTSFKHSIAKDLAQTLLDEYDSIYGSEFVGVRKDVLETRKSLTAGRIFLLTQMKLPPEFDFESGPAFKDYNDYFLPLQLEIAKFLIDQGITDKYGKLTSWGSVGISQIQTKISHSINLLRKGTELRFIELISQINVNNIEDLLTGIEKIVHDFPNVYMIDDKPTNPLNQNQIFEDINNLISIYATWKFNPQEARKFLKEIENESQTQEELMNIFHL